MSIFDVDENIDVKPIEMLIQSKHLSNLCLCVWDEAQ